MDDKPALLIVDDAAPLRERLAEKLRNPPQEWLAGNPIKGFRVAEAATADEARRLWDEAQTNNRPYDVVVLDWRLPKAREDLAEERISDDNGRDLLKYIRERAQAAIVVHTGYPSTDNMVHIVGYGATELVVKSGREDPVHTVFAALVRALQRTGEAFNRDLQLRRQLWLKDETRKKVCQTLARLVSEKTSQIVEETRLLVQSLTRRYGLDPQQDAEDPLCKQIGVIEQTAHGLMEAIRQESAGPADTPQLRLIDVGAMLGEEIARVRPSYYFHNVALDAPLLGPLQTRTFERDLRLVVDELLLSALDQFPDTRDAGPDGRIVEVLCRQSDDQKDFVLSVAYSAHTRREGAGLLTLTERDSQDEQPPTEEQGLALVRRIAANMGARLDVDATEEKTVVTLRIPVIAQ